MVSTPGMLLCGDIGGTKTTLALFAHDRLQAPTRVERYASQTAGDFSTLLDRFLGTTAPALEAACFGAAGPVRDERVDTTNLPWDLDAGVIRKRLGVPVYLLNDLEALAYGVSVLDPASCPVLNQGTADPHGTIAIIAAGTGLGEAGLVWDGRRHVALASEGGHADFSPPSTRELELLRYLLGRFGHASWERLLSGPGLVHIFEYLRDGERLEVPATLAQALGEKDPAAALTEAALAASAPVAVTALEWFVRLYGAEAGNLALKLKATGGVYVGGGIAPKILPILERGIFRDAFLAKGRFRDFLAAIPVRVVLEERTPLFGAARHAADRLAAASQRA
jgi:glucokinase